MRDAPPLPLAAELRRRRRERKLTLSELAARIGAHRNALQYWERGRVEPLLGNFIAWAAALGLEVELREK